MLTNNPKNKKQRKELKFKNKSKEIDSFLRGDWKLYMNAKREFEKF